MSIRDEERRLRAGHGGAVAWITGLSGAGKTTLADALERSLFDLGCQVVVLAGRRGIIHAA
jgi:adenylylsulfate kinase-like enzyme